MSWRIGMLDHVLKLVGGFNPFENISQNGNLPQVGVKIKNSEHKHMFLTSKYWSEYLDSDVDPENAPTSDKKTWIII